MDKKVLRKKYKTLRETLSEDTVEEFSLNIANRSLELPIWKHTYFHVFLSISEKKEVNTEYLLHILQGRDKSVVISKSNFSDVTMQHYLLQENTPIEISQFGIPEPTQGIVVGTDLLEVIFVPLLTFDINGNRVGYGKGFYDRFLAECSQDVLKVGLSFFEAEDQVPASSSDIPLDYCITPNRIYDFRL